MGNKQAKQTAVAQNLVESVINAPAKIQREKDFQSQLSALQALYKDKFVENSMNIAMQYNNLKTNNNYDYDKMTHIAKITDSSNQVLVYKAGAFGSARIIASPQLYGFVAGKGKTGFTWTEANAYIANDTKLANARMAHFKDEIVGYLTTHGFAPLFCDQSAVIFDSAENGENWGATNELAFLTRNQMSPGELIAKVAPSITYTTIYCVNITANGETYTKHSKESNNDEYVDMTDEKKSLLSMHVKNSSKHADVVDFKTVLKDVKADVIYLYVVCYTGSANCAKGGRMKYTTKGARYVRTGETAVIMCRPSASTSKSSNKKGGGLVKKTVRVYIKDGKKYRRVRCDDGTYKYVLIKKTY